MEFPVDDWTVAPALKQRMNEIRYGQVPDVHGWMLKV
jgi:branched-chain amino acid aminotransferase